ncbi:MAG TPA: hypothetical protein VKV02_09075 [Acidobacteriaceae bacterium]|nr:hypothetical protein [Acidobacteriaceae bacterium]
MASPEKIPVNKVPAPGWKGEFSTSNPAFAYPDPNLSSLPLLANMDNLTKIERQVHVLWPEFSWETVPGDPTSRCYQMFAPDISRAGYDPSGRIWSIICPQQGAYSPTFGTLNIEVTVTGQRGWMDESVQNRNADLLAADMNVAGKIWFGPSAENSLAYQFIKSVMQKYDLPFPLDKASAIQVNLHKVGDPSVPTIAVRSGCNPAFPNPEFALHEFDGAWGVANVEVGIGPIVTSNNSIVDDFNAMVMDIFNLSSGNILLQGNVLSWNVWFDAPSLVDQTEWKNHAEKWRLSIDTDHGSPDGDGTQPRYYGGTYFTPIKGLLQAEWDKITAWLESHFGITLPASPPPEWLPASAAAKQA